MTRPSSKVPFRCMAALRSGVDGKEDVPYDWEERGQERADTPYWSA